MRRAPVRHLTAVLLAGLACDAHVTPPADDPVLALSARDVRMFAPSGSVTPDLARVIVSNNGGGTLTGLAITAPVYEDVSGWLSTTLAGDTIELAASAQDLAPDTRAVATFEAYLEGNPAEVRTVTVVFEVGLTQRILLSADSLTFAAVAGLGSTPPPQTVTVQNAGTGILTELAAPEITPAAAQVWLAAVIDDSTAPARVHLRLVPGGLPPPGEYAATVVVSSRIAEPERDSVQVALIVAPPVAPLVSADSLLIDVVAGAGPVTRTVWVDEVSRRPLSAAVTSNAPWLTAAPDPVVTPDRLALTVAAAGLPVGTQLGRVTLTAAGGAADTILVAVRVRPGPALELGLDRVRFTTYQGGPVPPAQVVRIENAGHGTLAGLSAQVQPDAGWLVVPVPGPDTAPAAITLAIDPASSAWQTISAAGGLETRTVTVAATGAAPVTLPVTLDVRDGPRLLVSPDTVRFRARSDTAGSGTVEDSVDVAVANVGAGTLSGLQVVVTYPGTAGWLGITPSSDEAPFRLGLRPLVRLPAGVYRATVSVFSALDSAAIDVEYAAIDSLDSADALVISSDEIRLHSATTGGAQPGVVVWLENAAGGGVSLNLSGVPTWLDAELTRPNRQTPLGLVLTVDRNASDTVGTYTATINVTGSGVAPVAIPVQVVMSGPALGLGADAVTLRVHEGRTPLPIQPVTADNGGTGTLSGVEVTGAPSWLVAGPTTPSPAPVSLQLQAANALATGTYSGTVSVTASGGVNTPVALPVELTVERGPVLAVSPDDVVLASVEGDTLPVVDTLVVFNTGKGALGPLAAPAVTPQGTWLSAAWDTAGTPASPPRLIVRANPRGLPPTAQPRTGTIDLDSPDPGAAQVRVAFDVAPAPTLRRSPAVLTFTATEGLPLPADTQTVVVFDPEGRPTGALDVAVSGDTSWFAYAVDSTSFPAAIRVWPITVPEASDTAYTAVLTVSGRAAADTVRSGLQYVVEEPEGPVIDVSRDTLTFDRANPLAQTVQITNGGGGTLRELTVADVTGTDWLFVLLDGRIAPATLTVAVNAAAAADEPPNSVATLRIGGEGTDPRTITVILR